MIGPHYEKLAEVQNKMNARQLLQKIQSRTQTNPLNQIVQKLRKEFSEYETAYDDEIIDHHIHSVDRLLSFDGKLGPILSGLEKQNTLLRKQLSVLENQLSNTVSICEQILSQNNELKEIIKNKNLDLEKLIETIALNQSEERGSLQDKISLLEQQNSILIRHLDQIRKEHQGYSEKFMIEKQQAMLWKKKFEESKVRLTEILEQEQETSRKLSLVEHNLYNQSEKVYNLEAELQTLKFQNNQIKNELLVLKNGSTINNVQNLKAKLQEQYSGILEEYKALKKERTELLKEAQFNKLEKQEALDKMIEMEKIISKLQKDFGLTQSLLSDQKQKNGTLQSNISRIETKFEEIRNENNKLRLEIESTNNYALNKEKHLNREIEQLREELDRKSLDMEKGLKDLKQKTRILMDAKQGQLKDLNDTNIELRKLLQKNQGYAR